jgi:hypothetical protein
MITYMLPRKEKTDEFTVSELLEESEIYHSRCGGGKIVISKLPVIQNSWTLHCSRCDYQYDFELDDRGRADICKAAIDGEERKIKVHRNGNKLDYSPKRY